MTSGSSQTQQRHNIDLIFQILFKIKIQNFFPALLNNERVGNKKLIFLPDSNLLELDHNVSFQGGCILQFMTIVTIHFIYTKVLYPFPLFSSWSCSSLGVVTPSLKAKLKGGAHVTIIIRNKYFLSICISED